MIDKILQLLASGTCRIIKGRGSSGHILGIPSNKRQSETARVLLREALHFLYPLKDDATIHTMLRQVWDNMTFMQYRRLILHIGEAK